VNLRSKIIIDNILKRMDRDTFSSERLKALGFCELFVWEYSAAMKPRAVFSVIKTLFIGKK